MSRSPGKEIEAILDVLREQGWRITRPGRKSKFLAWPPDGVTRPVPIHATPSDWRWRENLIGLLRRAGADVA